MSSEILFLSMWGISSPRYLLKDTVACSLFLPGCFYELNKKLFDVSLFSLESKTL